MAVGATETWNETLINSWRVLRTNHRKQEQNEPTLDSRNRTWVISMHQLSLRHKSLSSIFPSLSFRNAPDQLYLPDSDGFSLGASEERCSHRHPNLL